MPEPSAQLSESLWPTTKAFVGLIDGLHTYTGLPWWATLSLTAVGEKLDVPFAKLYLPSVLQIRLISGHFVMRNRCTGGPAACICTADARISRAVVHLAAGTAERSAACCLASEPQQLWQRRRRLARNHSSWGGTSQRSHKTPSHRSC